LFFEGINQNATLGLKLGDSLVFYGKTAEFGNGTEVLAYNNTFTNTNGPAVRKISTGNHVPDVHVGTVNELYELPTNPNAEQWEGSLVKVATTLRVVRTTGLGTIPGTPNPIPVNNLL